MKGWIDDVPEPATSEAEALRGRGSNRWTSERPDALLPPILCAGVGIGGDCAVRAVLRRPRRKGGLQPRAHAERGAHGLVSRTDEAQLSAQVDALFVRPRILTREAFD